MTPDGPGPRDYTTGTERALYAFSATTCYFPGCTTSVIVFVDGEPVSNVEIAHIHGALRGSPRYIDSMTDDERRSFTNVILLCKPHHNIVDRLHPDDYTAEMLAQWKADHERAAGIDAGALAGLTEDRFVEMLEKVAASAGPQRLLTVELGAGIAILAQRRAFTMPPELAREYFPNYDDLGPRVLVLTVRSQGGLKAYVNGHGIRFVPLGTAITGIDHFPGFNPRLPCPVDIGESQVWIYDLSQILAMLRFFLDKIGNVDALVGAVELGSGETLTSEPLAVKHLLDSDEEAPQS